MKKTSRPGLSGWRLMQGHREEKKSGAAAGACSLAINRAHQL